MTALTALVLATITTLGGCTPGCTAPDLDAAPEIPAPDTTPDAMDALEEAPDPTLPDPAGTTALVDRLTQARLPGPNAPLTGGLLEDPSPTPPTPTAPVGPHESPTVAEGGDAVGFREVHVSPAHREPSSARGDAVHAASSQAHARGEAVPGAAAWTASLLAGLAAVGLYHKLSKDRALEHPARRRILAMLEADPGLTAGEVADELDVCYRTARHHLEVLARFDLAIQAKHRGSRRWARPEDAARLEPEVPEPQLRVLGLLEDEPGLHLSEIARRLDLAKATVKHHLDRLTERGDVHEERVGPLRRFEPADAAQAGEQL